MELMRDAKVGEAIQVFKLNASTYPLSANVYDGLGEAYMNHGDTDLAIENYKKSLELNSNNPGAAAAIKKLQQQKSP